MLLKLSFFAQLSFHLPRLGCTAVDEKKRRREIIQMKKKDNSNRSRSQRRKIRNFERDVRAKELGEGKEKKRKKTCRMQRKKKEDLK